MRVHFGEGGLSVKKLSILLIIGLVLWSLPLLVGQTPPIQGATPPATISSDKWIPRTQWGAPLGVPAESLPILGQADHTRVLRDRGGLTHVIVHHTGNHNDTVLTVWDWHVGNPLGQRWSDIGYHFMIDSQGNVYQGRSSIQWIGSHTGNANVGTVGIAFLGNFNASVPTAAALDSGVSLIQWLFEEAGITDPWEEVQHDNAGMKQRLASHRDYPGHETNECPGHTLYDQLDELLRKPVADLLGMPVFDSPKVLEIAGIEPAQPMSHPARQWLTILGNDFVAEIQVTLRVGEDAYPIPADRTQVVDSTRISVFVGLTDPGTWTVQIVNPSNGQSSSYSFVVAAP